MSLSNLLQMSPASCNAFLLRKLFFLFSNFLVEDFSGLGNCFTLAIMVFTLDALMFKSLDIFVISRKAVALFGMSIWV